MDRLLEKYRAARWTIPDDFMQKSHFERVVREKLDWTSSPGYPYMRRAPTNGDFFKVRDGIPDQERVDRCWQLLQSRLEMRDSDHIRLFIKAEPHKLKKIENHRFRLISSVSVLDQIIDHMLFEPMNQNLVDNWPYLPSKPGWTELVGGWRFIPPQAWTALDKSGWDWSMQLWVAEFVLELRCALCDNPSELWMELAKWRYRQLYVGATFITSGGLIFKQRKDGVQKSGCVNTIADNSIAQDILHERVCYEIGVDAGDIITMGDDTLQEKVSNWNAYLSVLGQYCHVKQSVDANEFAGSRFLGKIVEPLYKGKHSFNILHMNEDVAQQMADSYTLLYHRSRHRDFIRSLFQEMGLKVRPLEWCDAIYDGN